MNLHTKPARQGMGTDAVRRPPDPNWCLLGPNRSSNRRPADRLERRPAANEVRHARKLPPKGLSDGCHGKQPCDRRGQTKLVAITVVVDACEVDAAEDEKCKQ